VGFEVLKPLVTNNCIFWDITPCSPPKVNWRFGGTCGLHLQSRRIKQARNQHEAGSKQRDYFMLVSCVAYSPTLKIDMFIRNVGEFQTDYTASYSRRQNSKFLIPLKILKIFRLIFRWCRKENSRIRSPVSTGVWEPALDWKEHEHNKIKRQERNKSLSITNMNLQNSISSIPSYRTTKADIPVGQNYCVFALLASSGILQTRKHDVSEIGSVSVLRWGGRHLLSWVL
jgi:hypothetical protein